MYPTNDFEFHSHDVCSSSQNESNSVSDSADISYSIE